VNRRILYLLAILYGAATVLYAAAWMYYVRQEPAARLGIDWYPVSDQPGIVVKSVVPGSAAERAGLRAEDRILAVNGKKILYRPEALQETYDARPGTPVRLTVQRPGEVAPVEIDAVAEARPPESRPGLGALTSQLMGMYPVMFAVVGLTVLLLRVESGHAWLLALLFGALIATAPYLDREHMVHPAIRGITTAYHLALSGLTPALFYAFFAVFPAPSPIDRRVPWLKWTLLAFAGAISVPLAVACFVAGDSELTYRLSAYVRSTPLAPLTILYSIGPFVLGFASLVGNARFGEGPETRRKARVMLWGTAAGLLPILLIDIAALVLGRPPSSLPFWPWALAVIALLLWPLSFAYAVVKHRVLEIPVLLRRSARYLLVQRGFLALVALASLAASAFLVGLFFEVGLRGGSRAAPLAVSVGIAFGLGLAFTGTRLHRRVAQRIDRAFFRSSYDARHVLEELATRARAVGSREELADLLDQRLRAALQPTKLYVYFADRNGTLEVAGFERPAGLERLDLMAVLLSGILRSGRPWSAGGSPMDLGPLAALGPECLVPIPGRRSELLGLVVLGPRLSEEPYSGEDRALLEAAASQAGLALESIGMAEEIATRLEAEKRQTRELEIARDVQRKLLPQRRPLLSTLDYAADCTQARVVGGDYWDVLDLGPKRVGLVQADISGKGISAALLMANLQASLRSRPPDSFDDLVGLLRALNRHLHESTESSRYATLFLGTYDDDTRVLRYVNCGHGPPLLVRKGGGAERLMPTAPVVGLFEDWSGEVAEITLEPGDWLVLYTDGVTDATGPEGQEFGEERLLLEVGRGRGRAAGEVLTSVFTALTAWSAHAEQWDDQTLLLVRGV
jgi:phosphoserine phosphatase RsbU/P